MSKVVALPFRTTLSLPSSLGEQVVALAARQGVPVVELARKAIETYVEDQQKAADAIPHEAADRAQEILSKARELDNFYQQRVAAWRLSTVGLQIHDLSRSRRLELEARSAETYLLTVVSDFLRSLDEGDTLTVLSGLHFWPAGESDGSQGTLRAELVGLYMSALKQAIRKGVRYRKVILLRESDSRESLIQHARFMDEIGKLTSVDANVSIRVREIGEQESQLLDFGSFACVTRLESMNADDQGCMIAEPIHHAGSNRARIRLRFSKGASRTDPLTGPYVDRFYQAFDKALPLETRDLAGAH